MTLSPLRPLLLACSGAGTVPVDALTGDPADAGEAGDSGEVDDGEVDDGDVDDGSDGSGDGSGGGEGEAPCLLEGGALPLAAEGDFLARELTLEATRERCTQALHAGAGAAGSTLSLTLESWGGGEVELLVTDLLGEPLADWTPLAAGESLAFSPAISGEFLVQLAPVDPEEPAGDYALSLACDEGCELAYTRYPLVFFHGMGGTDAYLDLLDYWLGVEEVLVGAGYHVEIHSVTAWDPVDQRSAGWAAILDGLQEAGVGRRFNLIGHSQGGLDARYVTGVLDPAAGLDRIASVTTVASPHRGSPAADLGIGALDLTPFDGVLIDAVAEMLSALVGLEGDDLVAQIEDLSSESMAAFNEAVPDAPGVAYYSWAGHSCAWLDWGCQSDWEGEVIDTFLVPTYTLIELVEGANDGLVSVESAKWGEFLGELPADHLDEVGQLADADGWSFDHKGFFLSEADRLAGAGY